MVQPIKTPPPRSDLRTLYSVTRKRRHWRRPAHSKRRVEEGFIVSITFKSNIRLAAQQPSSDLEQKHLHIDIPVRSQYCLTYTLYQEGTSNGLETHLDAVLLGEAAAKSPTTGIESPKERFDICIQTVDPSPHLIEANAEAEHAISSDTEIGSLVGLELPSNVLEVFESVSSKLEQLTQAVKRLENMQKIILRRVNRKSSYNQFLLD
ncbi:RND family efflux transporter MFP subunit, putative [Babesia ovata]|uniref:RND family efflux transporter MFP subunit, putative n=1 Tax=Babesia ovata TaxID=189622 RepID=A0A2H6K709_9APIC|nr:RND family efflux transporter MFP subunit, putative [Babesia ovata]GBE58783.1 RND family efflux transporter MFP subunit, putative [Babesia ovata]